MSTSQVLLQLGYSQITSKSDKVFLEATQKALKVFGQSSYNDLMVKLRSKTGMSDIELIKNFNMFEDALKKSTGTVSSKIMIDLIKNSCKTLLDMGLNPHCTGIFILHLMFKTYQL